MFEELTWLDDRVLLRDLVFRIEHARNDRWDGGDRCFAFYKTRALVDQFDRFWSSQSFRPRHVLEIGIWDGGSSAFWWELLRPEKLVALDLLDREDSEYFRDYVAASGAHITTHWRTNQADRAAVRQIVDRDLDGFVDLVIDDGSHLYAPTKSTFELVFPLLPPGGLYIIEDWAWEHWDEFQDPAHIWGSEEGLGRLVRELVEATGSSKTLIRSVNVFEGFAVVERGDDVITGEFRLDDHIVRRPWRRVAAAPDAERDEVKAIAFYLPQFHPIPENDRWWGKGFTEWSRVSRARPVFADHYQPHVPDGLGFYDLRLGATREQQAALARAHGIHGFCYHYYWFGGRRLLERPLDEVLTSGSPDFPFCVCWANESWTRRWDGGEKQVLIAQKYSPELDRAFIEDLVPLFADRRYIRVNGNPLLIVYHAQELPDPWGTTKRWREAAREHGLPGLHLVAALTFGLRDPRHVGFDAAVEFPPHVNDLLSMRRAVEGVDPKFGGNVLGYEQMVEKQLAVPAAPFRLYRTAMPGWDNTPRLGNRATIFHGATPQLYRHWLEGLVDQARLTPAAHRMVFVNGWNEWAEGAHLEPDRRFGTGYLEATARALAPK